MKITTVQRTLTETDFGGKNGHGGVIIPNDASLIVDLKTFFEGVQNQQEFIDVRNPQKKYKLKYADYTSNGSTPNDRVTSINKYASFYDLEVCDTLILEKIEDRGEKTYLIDYVKKMQGLYLRGQRKDKASIPNASKFIRIINDGKAAGNITEPIIGEYHFDAKLGRKKKEVILKRDTIGLYEAEFGGIPLGFTSKKSFEIDFSKSIAVLSIASTDWSIEIDKPILFQKYSALPYELEEQVDPVNDDDIDGVTGNYSPGPIDKKPLKSSKSGKKIYPRDKKVSANALKRAHHLCEHVPSHKSFLRKNKKIKYMEPHHLIPLHMHEEFDKSLDVEANIVCLCSNCHNQIHYGDGRKIIEKLWDLRHLELDAAQISQTKTGVVIDKKELLKIYGY